MSVNRRWCCINVIKIMTGCVEFITEHDDDKKQDKNFN